jgi:hypothetical protein
VVTAISGRNDFSTTGGVGLALVLALAQVGLPRVAGAQTNEDFGIWGGATVTGPLPRPLNDSAGRWRLWTDVQLRFGDNASRFSQGVVRPGIGYTLGSGWTVWLGYAYIRTEPPYATSTTTEQRIWEQASWGGAVGTTRLSSRTRLEQRFVSTGSQTGWRLRELVKVSQPLGAKSIWSAVVYDEFFLNLNSTNFGATQGPDRNRFFVGPGVSLSRAVVVEVGYLNQYTYRNNGPDKNDNVLAVNLFWNY